MEKAKRDFNASDDVFLPLVVPPLRCLLAVCLSRCAVPPPRCLI